MIQALDLARENAMLKDEVDRLRRELAESVHTTRAGSSGMAWPDNFAWSDDIGVWVGNGMGTAAPLMLIMPRYRAAEYGFFAGRFASVPDCSLIIDRRLGERRRGQSSSPDGERRRGGRRFNQLDTLGALVLSVR